MNEKREVIPDKIICGCGRELVVDDFSVVVEEGEPEYIEVSRPQCPDCDDISRIL